MESEQSYQWSQQKCGRWCLPQKIYRSWKTNTCFCGSILASTLSENLRMLDIDCAKEKAIQGGVTFKIH